jgi:hypothetical protein
MNRVAVTKEQLEELGGKEPPPPAPAPSSVTTDNKPSRNGHHRLLVERWLKDHGIAFTLKKEKSDGRTVYVLETCPFNSAHGRDSCIMQDDNGKLFAQCFHNGCQGNHWQEFKTAIGPPEDHHFDPPRVRKHESTAGGSRREGETPVFPAPIPFSQLKADEATTARLWEKYIHAQAITLLSANAKAGKTTLIAHLLRAFEHGGDFCDQIVEPGRVLIVSEESARQWIDRGTPLHFGDHLEFVCRPFKSRADWVTWLAFIAHLARLVQEKSFSLVVLDTLGSLWPVTKEADASEVQSALLPLHNITAVGAGILLTHHLRKSGGDEGIASRGSSALPGFVDCILELTRIDPSDQRSHKRTLTAYGRWDVPAEVVIEWDTAAGQYVALGDRRENRMADIQDAIRGILPRSRPGLDYDGIKAAWAAETMPRKADILEALTVGFEKALWIRDGTGKRGSKYSYWVQE